MLGTPGCSPVSTSLNPPLPRPPTLSKSLRVKAGPTAMQKMRKQNLREIIMYENKPRPAARAIYRTLEAKDANFFNK